jgi:two-component system, cell cycle sensor histidine kinase and response regulator CckA
MISSESSLDKELKKFKILYDLAVVMTAERTLEENLQLVVERSRELLDADTAYIALRDETRGDVYMHTLSGIRTEAFKKMRLPFGKGLGGLVAKTRKGFILEDYLAERKLEHVVDRIVLKEGVISGMAVPIQMGPRNLGVLYVFNRTKTAFSQVDLDTLFLIGNLAAVEISRQEAEKSVRSSREQLEGRVRERTLELRQANQLLTQEIQERIRSEEALITAEAKYRSIFDNTIEGIFQTTEAGSFISANRALARMYGYGSPEELMSEMTDIGNQLYVDPKRREEFLRLLREKGEVQGFENVIRRKDGSIAVTRLNARQIRDAAGNVLYLQGTAEDITERNRVEEALKESETRYRTLVENLPIGIYRCTPGGKGRFLMANQAFLNMFGYEREEELKRIHVSDIYMNPDERKKFSDQLLDRKSISLGDRHLKRKDGTALWGRVTGRLVYEEGSGEPVYFDCAIEDITERMQAEKKLREYERRYRELVDGSRDGYVMVDSKKRYIGSNSAFREMLGYREEDLKGLSVDDITPEKWWPVQTKIIREQIPKRGYTDVFEKEYRRKDGTILPVEIRVYRARDEEGKHIGLWAFVKDITERKASEQALRESEKKYRDLFENVSDFIYTHDLEGRFLETNSAFRKACGFTAGGMNGLHGRDLVLEENRPLFDEYLKRIQEKGQDEGMLTILTRDGRQIILEYKNSLVRDSEGRPAGVRGSARDVTERIRAEKERKKLEAQLMTAQRIEAIGTLAGGIAHNFNNLLMGIQGNATLARMDADPRGPMSERLENIEKLVRSGAKLTSQLLGYAREGRYEVRPINLNELVRETAGTFGQARKDIVVHQELAEDLMGIEADQGQIEQVLLNLLVNAADAMPFGGKVFLRTRNVDHREIRSKSYRPKPGQYVELQVTDTGTGMDEKTLERIFEPFFTTKGLGKGTGLGLSSVYGTVKGHGGYVDVSSREGKGSTFTVHLPASHRRTRKEEGDSSRISMGHETVLLVDDEEVILDVGSRMMEVLGYRVLAAKGGREALEIYRKDPSAIDVVVLDMIMPDMGGGETFDWLKKIDPGVKVLLSSGYSVDGQAKEILNRGCSGFIQKPFHIQDLSQEIRRILGRA